MDRRSSHRQPDRNLAPQSNPQDLTSGAAEATASSRRCPKGRPDAGGRNEQPSDTGQARAGGSTGCPGGRHGGRCARQAATTRLAEADTALKALKAAVRAGDTDAVREAADELAGAAQGTRRLYSTRKTRRPDWPAHQGPGRYQLRDTDGNRLRGSDYKASVSRDRSQARRGSRTASPARPTRPWPSRCWWTRRDPDGRRPLHVGRRRRRAPAAEHRRRGDRAARGDVREARAPVGRALPRLRHDARVLAKCRRCGRAEMSGRGHDWRPVRDHPSDNKEEGSNE